MMSRLLEKIKKLNSKARILKALVTLIFINFQWIWYVYTLIWIGTFTESFWIQKAIFKTDLSVLKKKVIHTF